MNKKTLTIRKTLILTTLCIGCCIAGKIINRLFEKSDIAFIQNKTGISWPIGTTSIHIYNQPGCIRTHWIEAFVIIPQKSIPNIITKGFSSYDPLINSLDWYKIKDTPPLWKRWKEQHFIFRNTTNPLAFFSKQNQHTYKYLNLNQHIYYITGNNTGTHSFVIVLDSLKGSMWIHLNYPD